MELGTGVEHYTDLTRLAWVKTPKEGKYQPSSPGFTGGAGSAWSLSKILCINSTKCSLISDFLHRVWQRELKGLRACSLLFGRRCLGEQKGRGATQLLVSSMNSSLSINWMNCLSSTEGVFMIFCSFKDWGGLWAGSKLRKQRGFNTWLCS